MRKLKLLLIVTIVFVLVVSITILPACKTETAATTTAATTAAATTAAATTAAATTAAATTAAEKAISADLTLYSYWPGGTEAEGLLTINDAFTAEYPGITIEVIAEMGGMDYLTALATKMATADKPDMFLTWPMAGRLDPWIKQDLIIPLDDLLAEPDIDWANRAPSAFSGSTMADGHQWTFVFDGYYQLMFYNTKVFKDAGIKTPNTFDEFIDNLDKVQKLGGVIPLLLGAKDMWPVYNLFNQVMLSSLTRAEIGQLFNGEMSWGDDKARSALSQLERILPYIDKENSSIGYADAILYLGNGDGAMWQMGSWVNSSFVNDMKLKPVTDFNAFLLPTVKPEHEKATTVDANSVCIVKGSGKEEAAKVYLRYLARQDVQEKIGNLINCSAAVDEGINYENPFFTQAQEMLKGVSKYGVAGVHSSVESDMYGLVTSLFMGKISTEDFITKMDSLIAKSNEGFAQQ